MKGEGERERERERYFTSNNNKKKKTKKNIFLNFGMIHTHLTLLFLLTPEAARGGVTTCPTSRHTPGWTVDQVELASDKC